MKKLSFAMLGFFFVVTPLAMAASSATQVINIVVLAINELAISPAGPITMTVNAATAGSQPDAVTNSTTTYAITTNKGTDLKKITGSLSSAMPANVTLKASLAAPTGGASAGSVTLTTGGVDLVNAIDPVAESNLGITYTLSAIAAAGEVASTPETVTLTIVDE